VQAASGLQGNSIHDNLVINMPRLLEQHGFTLGGPVVVENHATVPREPHGLSAAEVCGIIVVVVLVAMTLCGVAAWWVWRRIARRTCRYTKMSETKMSEMGRLPVEAVSETKMSEMGRLPMEAVP
jgi:hypothetical protein